MPKWVRIASRSISRHRVLRSLPEVRSNVSYPQAKTGYLWARALWNSEAFVGYQSQNSSNRSVSGINPVLNAAEYFHDLVNPAFVAHQVKRACIAESQNR